MNAVAANRWQGKVSVVGFAVLMSAIVATVTAAEYTLLRVLPTEHWVRYSCMRPTQQVYNTPIVYSESCLAIYQPVYARWYDRIECGQGDNTRVQVWAEFRHRQVDEPRKWPFMINRPAFEGRDCRIVGSLVLDLSYGIKKTLDYRSDETFDVIYPAEGPE